MANMIIRDLYKRLTKIRTKLNFATGQERQQLLHDDEYYYRELRSSGHRAIFNRNYCKKVQSPEGGRAISRDKILTEAYINTFCAPNMSSISDKDVEVELEAIEFEKSVAESLADRELKDLHIKYEKDKDVEVELEAIEFEKSFPEALADMELKDMHIKYDKDKDKDEEVEVEVEATELEKSVAKALVDLELKDLHIKSAKQIDVPGNRKAIVIHLPNRLRKALRTIEAKAIREVEKKLSSDVVFIASRSLNMPKKKPKYGRRGMLKDIVHPAKHEGTISTRRPDGSLILTIYLDAEGRADTEYKVETFREVYKMLCGIEVFIRYWDYAMKKIEKDIGEEPNNLEETVAQALYELEYTNEELKSDLKDLYIKSAEEIHVFQNRKAAVIQIPYRLRERFRKIHAKLVRELGNMLSGMEVIFISAKKMSKKERMLEDIVYPAEIVGRHAPARDWPNGFTILLHPKDTEDKLMTFHQVYLELTGEYVSFEYAT